MNLKEILSWRRTRVTTSVFHYQATDDRAWPTGTQSRVPQIIGVVLFLFDLTLLFIADSKVLDKYGLRTKGSGSMRVRFNVVRVRFCQFRRCRMNDTPSTNFCHSNMFSSSSGVYQMMRGLLVLVARLCWIPQHTALSKAWPLLLLLRSSVPTTD